MNRQLSPEGAMNSESSQRVLLPSDYESIHAAVMETTRGRSFLEEFARRNRAADTILILNALREITGRQTSSGSDAIPTAQRSDDPSQGSWPVVEAGPVVQQGRAALLAILSAVERIQETGWRLQAKGSDAECCSVIDAQVRAIYEAAPMQELALVSLAQESLIGAGSATAA